MKQAIKVTRQVIDGPNLGDPLAASLWSEYPEAISGYRNLWLGRDHVTANEFYRISPAISWWLRLFDLKGPAAVEPFTLILDHGAHTADML